MSWQACVITLLPEAFPGMLGHALAGRALDEGVWSLDIIALRDFGTGKHQSVDDTPSGGGAGMVLRADIAAAAYDAAVAAHPGLPVMSMTPRGKPLTQKRVQELPDGPGVIVFCSRFEGVDERFYDTREVEEVSLGDYVLSGGEVAAQVVLDAALRLRPGVMGDARSGEDESFSAGLLEYPHYTRPAEFEGHSIPEILTSGDHAKVEAWRQEMSEQITHERRPDLWEIYKKKP